MIPTDEIAKCLCNLEIRRKTPDHSSRRARLESGNGEGAIFRGRIFVQPPLRLAADEPPLPKTLADPSSSGTGVGKTQRHDALSHHAAPSSSGQY